MLLILFSFCIICLCVFSHMFHVHKFSKKFLITTLKGKLVRKLYQKSKHKWTPFKKFYNLNLFWNYHRKYFSAIVMLFFPLYKVYLLEWSLLSKDIYDWFNQLSLSFKRIGFYRILILPDIRRIIVPDGGYPAG